MLDDISLDCSRVHGHRAACRTKGDRDGLRQRWQRARQGQGLELGKAPMTLGKAAKPVEQLTISIDDTSNGATLRIEWGNVSATAPFKVG